MKNAKKKLKQKHKNYKNKKSAKTKRQNWRQSKTTKESLPSNSVVSVEQEQSENVDERVGCEQEEMPFDSSNALVESKSDVLKLEPRPYQKECLDIIHSKEQGSYLVSMATGLGKTVVMSMIERRGKTLILSHRDELVNQPLKYFDCTKGIEKAEKTSHGEEVISASVQSMTRRLERFQPDEFDLIITDEAHHAAAKSYKKIYAYFKPRLHIGFTATPNRFDKVRLDDVFSEIIFNRDLKWGIQNGYLCDIDCYRANIGYNLNAVERNRQDFIEYKLSNEIDQYEYNYEIAETYRKLAKGQTLIFCSSIDHATHVAELIPGAYVISSKTPKKEREQILELYAEKKIRCLVNCSIFTEGTDLPMIETIIIARPTMNQSLYTQMVGRGLRLYPGKESLTLIDCVGVTNKLKVCTAPTLFGLDPSSIPERKRSKLIGKITNMESLIDELVDTPENWILQAQKIDLFSDDEQLETHSVNWQPHPNGTLTCYFGDQQEMFISAVDELGMVTLSVQDQKTGEIIAGGNKKMSPQNGFDIAYAVLSKYYQNCSLLWDTKKADTWGRKPSTVAQINYIETLRSMLKERGQDVDFDGMEIKSLTKGQASVVIGRLKDKVNAKKRM